MLFNQDAEGRFSAIAASFNPRIQSLIPRAGPVLSQRLPERDIGNDCDPHLLGI